MPIAAAAVCFKDDNIVQPANKLSALKRLVASVSASSSAVIFDNLKLYEGKKGRVRSGHIRSVIRPPSFEFKSYYMMTSQLNDY